MRYSRIIFTILVAFSCMCMLACGKKEETTQAEETTEMVSEETTEETTEEITEAVPEEEPRQMEVFDISDKEKELNAYRDNLKIYAKLYLPEGDGPYPVVILSNGAGASFTVYSDIAKSLAENGIAAVNFDFAGAVSTSKSEGSLLDVSVLTEAADLEALLEGVAALDYIDENNVFLWGHSMGGFVTTYVGCKNPDKVKGMMLAEPSYQFHDNAKELFPEGTEIPEVVTSPVYCGGVFYEDLLSFNIYDMMPNYSNDVIIFAGTEVPSIGGEMPVYLENAIDTFPSAELMFVEGADHQIDGPHRSVMLETMVQFVNDHAN